MQSVASSKAPLLRSLLLEALIHIVGLFLKTNERGTIPSPLIIWLTHALFITEEWVFIISSIGWMIGRIFFFLIEQLVYNNVIQSGMEQPRAYLSFYSSS